MEFPEVGILNGQEKRRAPGEGGSPFPFSGGRMAGGAKSAAKTPESVAKAPKGAGEALKSLGKASKGTSADEAIGEKAMRALRPSQCRSYMRRRLSEEFRGIVDGFVKSAREGSCQHVKLATELLEAPASRRVRSRRKGTAQLLIEEFERESR